MDYRFNAQFTNFRAEDIGGDGRISAGIIGNTDRADFSAPGGFPGIFNYRFLAHFKSTQPRNLFPDQAKIGGVKNRSFEFIGSFL